MLGLFIYWPVIDIIRTSAHQALLTSPELGPTVGLGNYKFALDDDVFRKSVLNTLYFTAVVVPGQTLLALLLALWCNGETWNKRSLRVAVFIPTGLSLTVLAVMWRLMYEPQSGFGSGLINGILTNLGLPPQPFLDSTTQAMPAIIFMSVWQGVGFQMMIFIAALQNVPDHLYEAATVDGASAMQRFVHVTLPGIAPTGMFVITITTIFALKLFVQPYVMTGGGPQGATISIVQYIYEAAFRNRDLGLASAAGVMFFGGVVAATVALRIIGQRLESLED